MTEPHELNVLLHGSVVGTLRYDAETVTFRISTEYIAQPDRPVLGQVFEDDLGKEHRVRSGVPPWFANLLPEGPLRELLAHAAGVHPSRDFFLLARLGDDLPGAVSVVPSGEVATYEFEASAMDESSESERLGDSEFDFKFSLAGMQMKFSVLQGHNRLTIPLGGSHGDSIVKLPDERYPGVPENEYSMMTWARSAGVEVPQISLIDPAEIEGLPDGLAASGSRAFLIDRFDRVAGGRVHIEDFAQVFNRYPTPKGKYGGKNYESIANVLLAVGGFEAVTEFVRRLVVVVAMGNGDAHLKNWSLIYPDRRTARLSPAYDLVATSTYVRNEETLALNLAKSKSFEDVTLGSFERMARILDLPGEADLDPIVLETVDLLRSNWVTLRDELPALDPVKASIDRRLRELPLMQL